MAQGRKFYVGPIGYVRSSIITVDFAIPFSIGRRLEFALGHQNSCEHQLGSFRLQFLPNNLHQISFNYFRFFSFSIWDFNFPLAVARAIPGRLWP